MCKVLDQIPDDDGDDSYSDALERAIRADLALRETGVTIERKFEEELLGLRRHLERAAREEAQGVFRNLLVIAELRRLAEDLRSIAHGKTGPLFVVSSLFLRESFAYVVKDAAEDMHFVTGTEVGQIRVLERMLTFEEKK